MAAYAKKDIPVVLVFFPVVGSMVTLGVFVLPALAYHDAGPAILIAYFLASLLMIPTALSMAELGSAMPGEGGAYFYVGRSMGPMLGFFAGLAKWLALSLKSAFALSGVGVVLAMYWPAMPVWQLRLAVLATLLVLVLLELLSGGQAGGLYTLVTIVIILALIIYVVLASRSPDWSYLAGISEVKLIDLLKVTGMVSVAFYEGLIKISAYSSKMSSPGRSVPLLIFSSFLLVAIFYVLVVYATLTTLKPDTMAHSLLPLADVAASLFGPSGRLAMTILAVAAFLVTASLSLIGAAHVPQTMAADGLLPAWLGRGNKRGFVTSGYWVTGATMAIVITLFDIVLLVKIASGMLLLLFTLMNLAVIVLRESKIVAYRPTYLSPFYPLCPVVGVLASLVLIFEIGNGPLVLTLGFFIVFSLVYLKSGRRLQGNDAALRHLVARLAAQEVQGERLDDELTRILKQRDNIEEDHFDRLIRQAIILDVRKPMTREVLFNKLASAVALKTDLPVVELFAKLEQREQKSTTLLSPTLAIPHLIFDVKGLDFVIVVVRCLAGVEFDHQHHEVKTVFCLAGSPEDRNFHLKALMNIAQIVQDEQFQKDWRKAVDEEELRNAILLAKRQRAAS